MRSSAFLVVIATTALTISCSDERAEVRFCNPADEGRSTATMHVDLENERVYGEATSSFIEPIKVEGLYGMNAPFPMLLFDDSSNEELLAKGVTNTLAGGDRTDTYEFTRIESLNSDLWFVNVLSKNKANGGQEPTSATSYLYSIQDGVLSLSFSYNSDWSSEFALNHVLCGRKTLRFEDMKAMFDRQE